MERGRVQPAASFCIFGAQGPGSTGRALLPAIRRPNMETTFWLASPA
jgi:hypothetical protein